MYIHRIDTYYLFLLVVYIVYTIQKLQVANCYKQYAKPPYEQHKKSEFISHYYFNNFHNKI